MKVEKGDTLKIEMQGDQSLRITPVLQARQDLKEPGANHHKEGVHYGK